MTNRWLGCLILVAVLAGCGGPVFFFPGGTMHGEVVSEPITDWSFVEDEAGLEGFDSTRFLYRLDPR